MCWPSVRLSCRLRPQSDALYDLLTAYPAARLTLRHPEMLVAHLGNYGELVLRVLADAAAENPAFTLNVQ